MFDVRQPHRCIYGRRVESAELQLPDGITLHYWEHGSPTTPPMLLLHALGETADSWKPLADDLALQHHVIALDLRGHGKSSWPGRYSFDLLRDDVLGIIDVLALRDLTLVGHSMGGVTAYLVAAARPDLIAQLIIEDIAPPFPRERALPERPPGPLPFDWDVVPAIASELNDPTLHRWPALASITAPTLVLAGGPTSPVPQQWLEQAAAAISDCELTIIPVGHDIHEVAPAEFTTAALAFLARSPS